MGGRDSRISEPGASSWQRSGRRGATKNSRPAGGGSPGGIFPNENTQFVREMHSHRNILLTQNTRFVLRFRARVFVEIASWDFRMP